MTEFPRNAVRERRMLAADKLIDCCCNPPTKEGEHAWSSNDCRFPSRAKFLVPFIFQSSLMNGRLFFASSISAICISSFHHLLLNQYQNTLSLQS